MSRKVKRTSKLFEGWTSQLMTTSPIFTFSDDIHNNSNNTEQSTKPSTPPSPSSASYLSSSSPSVSSAPYTVSSHSTTSSNLSVHPVPSFTLPGPSPSSPSSSHRNRGSSFKLPTKKSKVRKPAPNFPNGEAHSNNTNNTGNVPTSSSGLSSSAGAGGTGASRLGAGGAGGVPNGPLHYSMVEDIHNPWRMITDAVKQHDTKQLYKLIHQQGIDVNIRDKDGQSVLHVAAAETDAEELLLILMGCRADIQVSDNKRWTPLHVACNAGNWKTCRFLIERGADVNAPAIGNIQPIHYLVRTAPTTSAAMEEFLDVMSLLLQKGAKINHQTEFGETVLHYCAYGKAPKDVVRWLLKKGADPNLSDRKGATPLHMAVMRKRVKMIKILVSYGADLGKTSDWGTPLQLATQIGKSNPGLLPALLGANTKEESRSKIGVENEDPKEFMKRTIVKQLVKLQVKLSSIPTTIATTTATNISSSTGGTSSSSPPSSSSSPSSLASLDDLLFSTQNDVSNLIDTITNWIQKNNSKTSSSTPDTVSSNGNTTQVLSSDELILAIGKGITNKKPTATGKSVSPRTEGVVARRATVAEPPNASWNMLTGEESQAKIPSIGSYHLGGLLGRGASGRVFKAFNMNDGEFVAVKEVDLAELESGARTKVLREISILRQLSHENIVKYIDCHQEDNALYVIMEFIEAGSIQDALKKFGKFPESLISKLLSKLLDSLTYIHSRGIVHRDIKGANVMLTKEGSCKLTDFGIANQFEAGKKLASCVGTPYWMAPEMIVGETYSTPCDIWSLGCLAIELFTGSPPFSELSPMFAMFRIAETDDQVKPAPIPPEASKEFNSFLQYCLRRDPAHRGTAEQLKRHAFIRKYELLLPSFSGSSTSASTTLSSPTSLLGTMSSSASGLSSVVRSGSPPSPPSSLRSSSQLPDSHPSHDRRRNSF